ncbi:MAG TPA: alkaline phosphatase family protein [Chitinophagales bacterium]|nr:alkaline phosphatase family protein [Chitinophagales bacterium]HNJ89219.1 alkaline phosphatase family protein [Chitinophagales bacterium]HNM07601.1 alkaline phosphatase family protein [Chitinophagales bacterium]HNO28529.1 alkaline phosphatase family protein [Chitinophagales bacterium]
MAISLRFVVTLAALTCGLTIGGAGCTMDSDTTTQNIPQPEHVVIVMFENKDFAQVYDTSIAPFLQTLIYDPHTAVFTNSLAMGHPSQPNYIWWFSGDDQGVTTNDRPATKFNTPNLAAELIQNGFSFVTYSENLPFVGFDGDSSENGLYVRRHNPVSNWIGLDVNQVSPDVSQPFSAFPANFDHLPTVSFVVPNMINGMHNGTITEGDTWLQNSLSEYIEYCRNNPSLLVVTFDETTYNVTDNRILTLCFGSLVNGGEYDAAVSHVNFLRTFEDMFSLPHAGLSGYLEPISNCWVQE